LRSAAADDRSPEFLVNEPRLRSVWAVCARPFVVTRRRFIGSRSSL
jgi:hypothetical protein